MIARLKAWAKALGRDVIALWLAARDPRTPWQARLVAGITAAYALSPIDLIPDVIPVLGMLDDLLLVPAGIWLAVRLMPPALMAELREQAATRPRPKSRLGLALVVALWAGMIALVWVLGTRHT